MITSRIRSGALLGLLAILAVPAEAQSPPIQTPSLSNAASQQAQQPDGREASFLPPGTGAPSGQPVPLVPETAGTPSASLPLVTMPASNVPVAPDDGKPVELSQPVQSETLQSIDPDSIGLLSVQDGGLGAAMWKGTSLQLVTRVLPEVNLPTPSAALNGLAQRFLLTTANVPEGSNDSGRTLAFLRVEKLITLGDVGDAWTLAFLKPDRMDENTLRLVTEAVLVNSDNKDICAKLPDMIHTYTNPEWQKSLIVCQLRAGDTKGAQLGLEVLHSQNVNDDVFFDLAERNVIGGSKSLPRQLTPLRPLTMALLLLTNEPLPPELFVHPDAAEIPALLQAKTHDDALRLALAERSAARGLIGSTQLAAAYSATPFTADQLTNAANGTNAGAQLRALLYQAIVNEKDPQKRVDEIEKFLQSLDTVSLNSATAQLLAEKMGDLPVSADYSPWAADIAHIFTMAGRPKEALAWLKFARQAAVSMPAIASELQSFWPLVVLASLETDSDYNTDLHAWIAASLKDADQNRREQIGDILALFEASGFAVPEDVWAQVVDVAAANRRTALPSLSLLERLRAASVAGHRGETVLLALASANSAPNETPSLLPVIETVRALRLVGLSADSLMLARETVADLLAPFHAAAKP